MSTGKLHLSWPLDSKSMVLVETETLCPGIINVLPKRLFLTLKSETSKGLVQSVLDHRCPSYACYLIMGNGELLASSGYHKINFLRGLFLGTRRRTLRDTLILAADRLDDITHVVQVNLWSEGETEVRVQAVTEGYLHEELHDKNADYAKLLAPT